MWWSVLQMEWNVLFRWISAHQRDPIEFPTVYSISEPHTGSSCGCQGHCRLVLCGGWCLHMLNRTLCNYRMPLILHCFKDWLLLMLFNTCTRFQKETIPQSSAVRFILKPILIQVCLTTMAAMKERESVNTWDVTGLHAKFHQYQSGLYFDNVILT